MNNIINLSKEFQNPSYKYSLVHWWIWSGSMTEKRICNELDEVQSLGIKQVLIGAGYGVVPTYLTHEWFKKIQFAINEAKKRDLRIWIADEGSYPSGFAGGEFTRKHQELCMKALVLDEKIKVKEGTKIIRALKSNTIGALAVENETNQAILLDTGNGKLDWIAPKGYWEVIIVKWEYVTSPTRYVHHPTGAKDTTFSLCDYLDKCATCQFIYDVYEKYKRYIGEEFGKTVLGFFGDEPDYSIEGIPWTNSIFDIFEREKGYDIKPYIPYFFSPIISEVVRKAKADYWDVWSLLFRENFFKPLAEWCEKNNLEYIVHLNHEDMLMQLIQSEGDFFRCMRYVQVPAIDVIWRQIWMEKIADFPKLASSVAHLYGKNRAFSESFAVYGNGLTIEQAKWVIDYQAVRGINYFLTTEFVDKGKENPQSVNFPVIIKYINRICYLLSSGKPSVHIGVYFPTLSMWLEDKEALENVLDISKELLEHQMDFDFVDDEIICLDLISKYSCIIIPKISAISQKAYEHLRDFALKGQKVIYLGNRPPLLVERSFLNSCYYADMTFFLWKPTTEECINTIKELPFLDVKINEYYPSIKYIHRQLENVDLYFFFNEKEIKISTNLLVKGTGNAQIWDAETGEKKIISSATVENKYVKIPLILEPFESKFIVIGENLPMAKDKEFLIKDGQIAIDLSKDLWLIKIGNDEIENYLMSWQQLGYPNYSGAVYYYKEFNLPDNILKIRNRYFLECDQVMYSIRAWFNGKDLGSRAWRPYRWDITALLKSGKNSIRFEVRNTPVSKILGDTKAAEKLKKESNKNFYLAMTMKFDSEMISSGLLGPVRITAYINKN
ncbi:glycosyl hydrolase [Thermoanaerobacterium thermosaccharolyticum]|uniref:glycosyl hydrolase n=1 Tax=Thermoanaerobacterium thermosaccharolyticum TaxID=1517 RepID=UPI003D296BC6